jgi:hypothetical protein
MYYLGTKKGAEYPALFESGPWCVKNDYREMLTMSSSFLASHQNGNIMPLPKVTWTTSAVKPSAGRKKKLRRLFWSPCTRRVSPRLDYLPKVQLHQLHCELRNEDRGAWVHLLLTK